jgi:3-dehydroquinate synthetase
MPLRQSQAKKRLHGEAVAIGMYMEAKLRQAGLIDKQEVSK